VKKQGAGEMFFFKKIAFVTLLILMVIIMEGCWDNKDVTVLSFVVAMGLDLDAQGKTVVTVQVAKPSVIGINQKIPSPEPAVSVYSSSGLTVFDAVRNTLSQVNEKLYFHHLQILVISEEIARKSIADALDFMLRDHEGEPMAKLLVAKGCKASEVIEALSDVEDIPAMHLISILDNSENLPFIRKVDLFEILKSLEQEGVEPVVGVVTKTSDKTELNIKDLRLTGAAVFKGDKLVGWLDLRETRGFLFVENRVVSGIINIDNPLDEGKMISIEMTHSTANKDVVLQDGELKILIEISVEADIGNKQGTGNLTSEEVISNLEREVEGVIKNEVQQTVELAQKVYKSDIFGFGEIVRKSYPHYWEQISDWNESFSELPLELRVVAKIRGAGLLSET